MTLFILFVSFGSLTQILCQLPPHVDLQKIDEIMFDRNKYNVLKPTIHITKDHFKDFILKRDNSDFPGRKLYVDRNGIRHYWDGFVARRPKSLRKAILVTTDSQFNEEIASADKHEVSNKERDIKLDVNVQGMNNSTVKPEITKKVKDKPRRKKKPTKPNGTVAVDNTIAIGNKLALRDSGKTKVKTTFFCPFFGVVTMISYID